MPRLQRCAAVEAERARQEIEALLIDEACRAEARGSACESGEERPHSDDNVCGCGGESAQQRAMAEDEATNDETTDDETTEYETTDHEAPGAHIIIYARVAGDG